MKERQHSLKSNLVVGFGGLGLALAAVGFSEGRKIYHELNSSSNNANTLYGTMKIDCEVDRIDQKVDCGNHIPKECEESLMSLLSDEDLPALGSIISLPENCGGYGIIRELRLE